MAGLGSYWGSNFEREYDRDGAFASIGRFTCIGKNVTIFLGGNHHYRFVASYPVERFLPDDDPRRQSVIPGFRPTNGDVTIGSDCWIGDGACILSGVTIGDGAVVGTRALVTHDVAPYRVVGGNPASVITKRFTDSQIEALLAIRWWDWTVEQIAAAVDDMLTPDVDAFIAKYLPLVNPS